MSAWCLTQPPKRSTRSFPAAYRSFPVRRNGELVGSVVTFLDITEQKRVTKALCTQQFELAGYQTYVIDDVEIERTEKGDETSRSIYDELMTT